ncbi:MAG: hypothetical protein ACJAVK_001223 [Akkermansiaceae bacterium]|jgi:hypothetical protein
MIASEALPAPAIDLQAIPPSRSYERIALALLDTKAEDFPSLYKDLKNRPNRSFQLDRLFFLHWTRLDPKGAISAARGSDDLRTAYRMWACHEPGKALVIALERQEFAYEVAWGIGEYRPKWLEENWDQVPENLRLNASSGSRFWPDRSDPEAAIRMILKSGTNYARLDQKNMLALARQDPAKAYHLIKSIPGGVTNRSKNRHLETLFSVLGQEEPALLEQIAALAKSPIERNQIKEAQFKGLLIDDQSAAKAMLDRLPESWLKEDLAFEYATHLLAQDPEQGFPQALETFKNQVKKRSRSTQVMLDSGGGGSGVRGPDTDALLASLVQHNAPVVMDDLMANINVRQSPKIIAKAGRKWAAQDLASYADWLDGHRDNQKIYQDGIQGIVGSLSDHGQYRESLKWVERLPGTPETRFFQASNLYQTWLRGDPEGALAWRRSAEFSGDPELFPLPTNSTPK